jgi:hypothetical protein
VGVDEAGGENLGGGDLLTERLKVFLDSLPVREDLRDVLQIVLPEQGVKPLPILRWRQLAFNSSISGCLELRENVLPLASDAPKVAKKYQVHAPLYFAYYLPNASRRAGQSALVHAGRDHPTILT